MKTIDPSLKRGVLSVLFLIWGILMAFADGRSVYTQKPNDPEAIYFTPANYPIRADGKMDVSDALQQAINTAKKEKNFGIVFIPEGKYLISKTIYIPKAIRLIGYGSKRPEIILGKNTSGFQNEQNYMIWFTGNLVEPGDEPSDANPGTFYSALSNVDLTIAPGNPAAVAIRSHFAQHSFISHSVLNIGEGKAGIYDLGNEIENIEFHGGEYGISSSRTSPGWPMMMVDLSFEGQRKAAILTREAGLTIVNLYAKNVPVVVEMEKDKVDRLFIENSQFLNISKAAIMVSVEGNAFSQLNLQNIDCKNVPHLISFLQSGKTIPGQGAQYKVKDFTYGLVKEDMLSPSTYKTISQIEPLAKFPNKQVLEMRHLPDMKDWVNIKELGAKGDGETDDTQIFQKAIDQYETVYVPQGWYHISNTLKLKPNTKLIGLHPYATQLVLQESEPEFSGFGTPKPVVESAEGGEAILNGIGINTGAYNYRAIGCKWMAGPNSLINDVKFVGGHGNMPKPDPTKEPRSYRRGNRPVSTPEEPVYDRGMDLAWDNQYWSLWITNNGGGTFKDIWTASTYATNGLYVSHTNTPGKIYAMSLEHHVRNEARFDHVSNWKVYAFQFEEEGREGPDDIMVEMAHCKDISFANVFMYRVIRAHTPKEFGFRLWDSENIHFRNMHNYTQILQVIEVPIYDVNKDIKVYEWDFARLDVTGKEPSQRSLSHEPGKVELLGTGYEFASGATTDSKGNVYFCEHRLQKIYKWDIETHSLSLLVDYPLKPFALSTDTQDNLLVVFRYDPQPGLMVDGKQQTVPTLPDDNPMYSSWGNGGWAAMVYAIDPKNPDATMTPLDLVPTSSVAHVKKVIHPSARWRSDFEDITMSMPANSYVAPDGVTLIPDTYDLSRASALTAVVPGQKEPVFIANENNKTTVQLDVDQTGKLTHLTTVHPQGQYSNVVDKEGNLYIADGQIYVYNKNGEETQRITIPERPISITIGGKDRNTLFITTSTSFYAMVLP